MAADQDLIAQMNKPSLDKGAPAKTLEEVLFKALEGAFSLGTKMFGAGFVGQLGTKSFLAQFESEGFKTAPGLGAFDVRGGPVAEVLMGESGLGLARIDFKGLAAGEVGPLERYVSDVQAIPIESLGQLTPMHTGGGMMGGGMSLP